MSAGGGKLKKEPSPATNLKLLPVWRVARRHIERLLCSVVLIEGLLLSPFRPAQLFTQIGDLKYGGGLVCEDLAMRSRTARPSDPPPSPYRLPGRRWSLVPQSHVAPMSTRE